MEAVLYDIILPPPGDQLQDFETTLEFGHPEGSSTPIPKRKPAWSDAEQGVLLEEVAKLESTLFGKFRGSGRGKKEREAAWDSVATAVNQTGVHFRTGKEAAKQYTNLKTRAKEKISNMKRPKTGGGPKLPSPTPVERQLLNSLEGRPSLKGLDLAFDSGDMEVDCQSAPEVPRKSTNISVSSHSLSNSSSARLSGKGKSLVTLQKELLEKEIKKMDKEMEVLDLKKDKLKEEIEFLKLKRGKLLS